MECKEEDTVKIELRKKTNVRFRNQSNIMEYSNKTRQELIHLCKEKEIKGYSTKKKEEIIQLLLKADVTEKKLQVLSKKELGQYFTIDEDLQQFVWEKIKYRSSCLLEPSFGAGHLLKKCKEYDDNYPMVCYEIDETIEPVISFNEHQIRIYGDFTKQTILRKFHTIIGNPPYVKQKSGNLYIKFIEQCYDSLEEDGEMIMIVPSDFIKVTSASKIVEKMMKNGSFTDFKFPHNERLFEGASVDVMVFRYEKGRKSNKTIVNGKEVYCMMNHGIITFGESERVGYSVDSKFHVYVGMVSGRDDLYRVPFGNIDLLEDKDRVEKYIFTQEFPTKNDRIDTYLEENKKELLKRKIRRFSERNWFEWGAPRNLSSIQQYWGNPCIYIRNMTRQKEVAFMGKVEYFGGMLLCLVPKQEMTEEERKKVVSYLNSSTFQEDYLYSGRFKIGQKQMSNAIIPV